MTGRGVTVVVVTFNNADEIRACLDAALAQGQPGFPVQVVAVDNASTDGTTDVLRVYGARVDPVLHTRNSGFAAGVNAGVAAAREPHVLLLNPDCVMDGGCARALRDHLATSPDVGAAAALLRNTDGTPQLFCRRELTLAGVLWDLTEVGRFLDARLRHGRGSRHRRYAEVDWSRAEQPVRVAAPAGACVLVERPSDAAPLMDERFPLYFNDGDLYWRLRKRGLFAEVVPAATAVHGYGTTVRRLDLAANRAEFVAAMRRYVRKHWPRRRAVALEGLLLADGFASGVGYLVSRHYPLLANARGILGGFGLPLGVEPPLTRHPA